VRVVSRVREIDRMSTKLWHTLVAALVITGVQWAVAGSDLDWRVRLAVLAVPALFAGGSVARLTADDGVVHTRRGGGHR
jgi:hypothetical protein